MMLKSQPVVMQWSRSLCSFDVRDGLWYKFSTAKIEFQVPTAQLLQLRIRVTNDGHHEKTIFQDCQTV
jgi:hypothetical protein